MRSMKRPRRPVHRYRSLLFPGIALLALFAFWAAFVPAERPAGETALFEYGGLKMEISHVREVRRDVSGDGGPEPWEYPVYTVYPGAAATVLEAGMEKDGGGAPRPTWFFYLDGDRRLDVVDGMEPVELTPETLGMVDGDGGAWLLRFEIWEETG